MGIQFDETKWPDLTAFRQACLAERLDDMQRIADLSHHWYLNENPESLGMAALAKIFQAQHYAAENDLPALRRVIERDPWTVNYPWTAQGWLPITQAASAQGDRRTVAYLLASGADPSLSVGSPEDRMTVPAIARSAGHTELAQWLDQVVADRQASNPTPGDED